MFSGNKWCVESGTIKHGNDLLVVEVEKSAKN